MDWCSSKFASITTSMRTPVAGIVCCNNDFIFLLRKSHENTNYSKNSATAFWFIRSDYKRYKMSASMGMNIGFRIVRRATQLLRKNQSLFAYQNGSTEGIIKLQSSSISSTVPSPETIILNDKAVKQMKKVCADGSWLRITVDGGGCSGFQYLFSLIDQNDELADDDVCVTYKGVSVVLDEDSLNFLKGSTLDYNTELIRSAFRIIDNPQAEQGCSCGASFAIKD